MSENCNCGHHHDHEEKPLNKYEQALSKYRTNISDEEVRNAVKQIIAEKVHENDNLEVKKFLMGSVELTTLKTTDSEESVLAFTEKVNQFDEAYPDLPHVATICVYPCFAKTVSESLEVDGFWILGTISRHSYQLSNSFRCSSRMTSAFFRFSMTCSLRTSTWKSSMS